MCSTTSGARFRVVGAGCRATPAKISVDTGCRSADSGSDGLLYHPLERGPRSDGWVIGSRAAGMHRAFMMGTVFDALIMLTLHRRLIRTLLGGVLRGAPRWWALPRRPGCRCQARRVCRRFCHPSAARKQGAPRRSKPVTGRCREPCQALRLAEGKMMECVPQLWWSKRTPP